MVLLNVEGYNVINFLFDREETLEELKDREHSYLIRESNNEHKDDFQNSFSQILFE